MFDPIVPIIFFFMLLLWAAWYLLTSKVTSVYEKGHFGYEEDDTEPIPTEEFPIEDTQTCDSSHETTLFQEDYPDNH